MQLVDDSLQLVDDSWLWLNWQLGESWQFGNPPCFVG